ncbi:type II toxin-antitoxin system VapC family toxin [Shivajiella indica]|uniref:Type II toxin-antitoxin system VapC family toxin n=1 Tax=Shivajiella indica TaxID=872115 RepID=A0ABW5BCB7_9BACT
MAFKVFFDANIILDFFLKRKGNEDSITNIFRLVDEEKIEPYLSISILQICAYYLERAHGATLAKQILERILNDFKIITGDKLTVLHAIKSDLTEIEDAIHYFMALENKMEAIVTSELKFIKYSSPTMPILTAQDLVFNILKK